MPPAAVFSPARVRLLVVTAAVLMCPAAFAQGAAPNAGAGDPPREVHGSAVDPGQGGVGGTGLGKVSPDDTTGKGMSVQGPAGQGVPTMQKPDIPP